ncbi:MAG TPA: hypothetical protein VI685_03015 [Candidatus Angelobacter sp.]
MNRIAPTTVILLILCAALMALAQEAPPPAATDLPATNDPREIVRRSVEIDHRTMELARNYTCQQREVEKHLDSHGKVKSTESRTWDITVLYGEPYSRLIKKNDQPLSEKDEKKEEEKQDKYIAERKNESEDQRRKREAKQKKEREEGRAFLRDVENAYDFRMVGEEKVDGRLAWVLEATPHKGFQPTQPHADILPKLKGRIWIDKQDYDWVKAEAEAIDTISFGWFLARIHKGSHFSFEQTRLNDEVWLLRRFYINASARVLLFKNMGIDQEDTFANYKKFKAETKILPGVREVEPK